MIVPFGAGGGADQVARAMSREFEEIMGVGVQIVNKPGAGGLTALPDFMIAPADGYTILQHTDGIVTGFAAGQSPVEPGVDALPICVTQIAFSMLLINPEDERFSDWESMLAYAKESGESLRIATSSGVGSHEHVTTMQVAQGAGVEIEVVPFGDPGERYSSIIGGHIDLLFDQAGDSMPYVREGQLKPILVILRETPEAFAGVPSLTDVGLDFEPTVKMRGFWVRADTPEPIRAYLAEACRRGYETERYLAFNEETYTHLVRSFYDADEALALSRSMLDTYRTMFAELGVTQ
jgi:tripartite-type tricarboxylate transporter receptor subunit TctC